LLHTVGPRNSDELESALADLLKQQPDALLVTTEAFTRKYQARILDFANGNAIPTMFEDSSFVEAGGLMSYGPDYQEVFRTAAVLVGKILKGAKPADLPVQQATKFEFVVNLKAAKQIGLTISPDLLARANKVIK
jgi:putative tryptophan/tyrosine transport system substrate-binding protein